MRKILLMAAYMLFLSTTLPAAVFDGSWILKLKGPMGDDKEITMLVTETRKN
jgi:hypothetical protein